MAHAVVGGRRLYYERHGPERGVPLLLIMGMGGSCRGWLPLQVPALSAEHPVLIYDHRGVGGSDDPGGGFSTAELADDAAGLLQTLGLPRAHVLGAFLGGMVAQELALRHAAKVDRLVLVGTYARPDAKRRMLLEQWRELALGGASAMTLVRERLLWTLDDETLEQQDLIDSMVEFFVREDPPLTPDLFARQCDACLHHDTSGRLKQIEHTALVVCGRQDQLTPARFHRSLADEMPNAHLVTIVKAGHLVMAEAARAFNRTVLDFLDGDD